MIRVLVAEDDPMVAEMNRFYLEQADGFLFAGWASSGESAPAGRSRSDRRVSIKRASRQGGEHEPRMRAAGRR